MPPQLFSRHTLPWLLLVQLLSRQCTAQTLAGGGKSADAPNPGTGDVASALASWGTTLYAADTVDGSCGDGTDPLSAGNIILHSVPADFGESPELIGNLPTPPYTRSTHLDIKELNGRVIMVSGWWQLNLTLQSIHAVCTLGVQQSRLTHNVLTVQSACTDCVRTKSEGCDRSKLLSPPRSAHSAC